MGQFYIRDQNPCFQYHLPNVTGSLFIFERWSGVTFCVVMRRVEIHHSMMEVWKYGLSLTMLLVLNQGQFCSSGNILQCPEIFCHSWRRRQYWQLVDKGHRDSSTLYNNTGHPPQQRIIFGPYVNSIQAEKPYMMLIYSDTPQFSGKLMTRISRSTYIIIPIGQIFNNLWSPSNIF